MGNIYEIQKKLNKIQNKTHKKDSEFCLKDSGFYLKDSEFCLKDSDFYPPADTRMLCSLIEDIDEENNYLEYAEFIYDLYEEEGYYEN